MGVLLLVFPVLGMLAAFALRHDDLRPWILPGVALGHLVATLGLLLGWTSDWFVLDPPGRLVLGAISVLFAGCSIYAVPYLRFRHTRPNRVFVACLCALLGTLSMAVLARHLGLMWVAVEASALAAGPLIYFNHNPRSIEATWKYLMVGSVGIALALLGTFFLAYSAIHAGAVASLRFDDLAAAAPQLSKPWLHAGFALILVGFGTKMGLAPMHTWKPDAYGEAPGLAGALLAGGVTSVAFLAIVRVLQICHAAGDVQYAMNLLIGFGLVSMAVAGALMIGQHDFKRMLAYSSVEHMGILAVGIGIGGAAALGAFLHLVVNALTKGVLFLAAANLHRGYGSKSTTVVTGALSGMPVSATLFLLGFLAITGAPPFGPFVSEVTIVRAALADAPIVGALFVILLMIVFIGMAATVLKVTLGTGPAPSTDWRDRLPTTIPIVAFLALVLLLGCWIPGPLEQLLHESVTWLEAHP